MIKYIKRKDLDIEKYNNCIENAIQSRVYAFSWYLDIVSENWDVLVLDDYKAVMPIPWKQKYFIKYISQPIFCQQLGVFSIDFISEENITTFINAIPKRFLHLEYQFNSKNSFNFNLDYRVNYILNLHNTHDFIRSKFRKDRKYRINQVEKKHFKITNISAAELIQISKEFYKHISLSKKDYKILSNLIDICLQNKNGFLIAVKDDNKEILGATFFIKNSKRIVYLFSVVTKKGKENNIASLLINEIIKQNCNSILTLDFEGSMIPGIASFYRSFGATSEKYGFLKQSKFSFLSKSN